MEVISNGLSPMERELLDIGIEQMLRRVVLQYQLKNRVVVTDGPTLNKIINGHEKNSKKKKTKNYYKFYPRCDICKEKHRNLDNFEILELKDDSFIIACVTHSIQQFWKIYDGRSPLKEKKNETCLPGLCQCRDLVSTCTGEFNRASAIAKIQSLDAITRYMKSQRYKQGKVKKTQKSYCDRTVPYKIIDKSAITQSTERTEDADGDKNEDEDEDEEIMSMEELNSILDKVF